MSRADCPKTVPEALTATGQAACNSALPLAIPKFADIHRGTAGLTVRANTPHASEGAGLHGRRLAGVLSPKFSRRAANSLTDGSREMTPAGKSQSKGDVFNRQFRLSSQDVERGIQASL